MADTRDFRRRIIGILFLGGAIIMLILGETALRQPLRSHPAAFFLFWLACFILLAMSVLVAILDLAVVRRRVRQEQRALLEKTIHAIEETRKSPGQRKSGNEKQK